MGYGGILHLRMNPSLRTMESEITDLRPACPADIDAIHTLVAAAFGKYVQRIGRKPQPMLTDYRVAQREHQLWVLSQDQILAAVLELAPRTGHLLVVTVAVSPAHQSSGFGRRLMAFAEAEAKRQGLPEVRLYTNERLTENLTFYARLGYHETHREPASGGTKLVHMAKAA